MWQSAESYTRNQNMMQEAARGGEGSCYSVEYACRSIQGLVRRNHEDNLFIDGEYLEEINEGMDRIKTGTLTVRPGECMTAGVFDGMGGESAGETAAYLAARRMHREYEAGNVLEGEETDELIRMADAANRLCQDMNESVCRYAAVNNIRTMGCTAAYILFGEKYVTCANVGDSRIYRMKKKHLSQLSVDHVRRSFLYRKGPLTQFLGVDPEEMILQPHILGEPCEKDTVYLLCTDGVTDMLDDRTIQKILSSAADLTGMIEKMEERILQNGAVDNATMLVFRIS